MYISTHIVENSPKFQESQIDTLVETDRGIRELHKRVSILDHCLLPGSCTPELRATMNDHYGPKISNAIPCLTNLSCAIATGFDRSRARIRG